MLVRVADGALLVERRAGASVAVHVHALHRMLEVSGLKAVRKVDTDQVTVPVRVR